MKKLILLLVAVLMAPVVYAQSSLVATLSHGDVITMYYGSYALRDAHNAAVSGDVINLSGGSFQAVDITKAVTIRGIGIDATMPTYIINGFTINVSESGTNRLSMEGIRCNGEIMMKGTFNNPYFLKCLFSYIEYDQSSLIENTLFADCKIITISYWGTGATQFLNCYVGRFRNDTNGGSATFVNCILLPTLSGFYDMQNLDYIINSQLINCIICKDPVSDTFSPFPSTTTATNCISIGFSRSIFDSSPSNTGNMSGTYAQVFNDYTGTYSDEQTFELTDEAKTQFLGTDGTEVGLYGGMLPYTSIPSYPRITKMNVANKTTADGKLSVELEVSAAE